MDFQGRYKLLEMLSDGEARTFKALQTSSGRIVLLHQLYQERTPPDQPDLASLVFGFLRRATAEEMKSLVDMGEEASRVFVVTEDLPGCQDLRQWLQPAPGTPGTAGKESVPKSAPSGDSSAIAATMGLASHARQEDLASPGPTQVFTTPKVIADQVLPASTEKTATTPATQPEPPVRSRTFASPDKLAARHLGGVSEAEVLKAAKPPVAPPGPPPASKEAASEFTRMFLGKDMPAPESARHVSSPPEKPSAPPAPTTQKPPERPLPAGFEVVYESGKQQPRGPAPPARKEPVPPPPPAPGREEGAPGEFTRIFYGRDESKAIPPHPELAPERTRLPSLAPAQPPQPEGSEEFTRLFQALHVKEKPPAAPSLEAKKGPSQSPPPLPSAAESEGPGEFTRLFHAGAQPSRPAGPPILTSSPRPSVPLSSSPSPQGPGELTQLIQGYKQQKSGPTLPVPERPEPVAPPPPPTAEKAKPDAFTLIFQQPPEPTTPPPAAPSPPVVQTPPTAPPSPEPDEYMRMFELPGGGAGAPLQGAPQVPPPAVPQPAAGRPLPVVPVVSVSPPVAPSMPYVQPPVVPQPQPYQIPAPQLQQPVVPSPYVMPPQPVMPQMQPLAVPVPVAPQAAPPKTGKSKFLVPLIILGGLFLITVGLILFFALKH